MSIQRNTLKVSFVARWLEHAAEEQLYCGVTVNGMRTEWMLQALSEHADVNGKS